MLHKRWVSLIGGLAFFVVAFAVLFIRPAVAGRLPADRFPNIELTTQDGKKVHFYDDLIKDKIVAINLIYTSCNYSCPLETARLAQVQKMLGDRMGKDIFFYSISIDPQRDTPAELKAYAAKYHVGPGWTFLTGKKEEIDFLSKKLGLYSDPKETLDGHTANLLIGNEPAGQWMRNSATDNPRFLAQQIGDFIDSYKGAKPSQAKTVADGHPLKFDQGQYLFGRQCAPCHTIGNGDKIGPDLLGITNVRNHDWLTRMIQRPDLLLASKDPIATSLLKKYNQVKMPNMRLDDEEVYHILGYMHMRDVDHDKEAAAAGNKNAANAVKPVDEEDRHNQ